ncbi:synaptogyrin-3 isoform X2 [Bufo gargarizans]|uniref:synaptogyrin-3 isoform X2 n=1 Tax=Bufo gargarizans TaxID=30331 RepID=UPI001CF2555D|nr:synaptogyrin-3 isoform X2 [Bufo gargarizans]
MEGASFGAGRAGAGFDPIEFLKQPQTILRIASWVFSVVVFGSIVNEGYINIDSPQLHCVYNRNEDACNYAISVGIIAFFACVFFIILDINFPQISSVKDRKKAVILDMGFSGLWSFLWFVCFCFLANQWQRTPKVPAVDQAADAARAAIAFSFFSIISWPLYSKPRMSEWIGCEDFRQISYKVLCRAALQFLSRSQLRPGRLRIEAKDPNADL